MTFFFNSYCILCPQISCHLLRIESLQQLVYLGRRITAKTLIITIFLMLSFHVCVTEHQEALSISL
jgi:hypothetical protein